ncbi:SGNH/GDSL hydrolase family protein [Legionella cardiaca]|uniref:SGNH/GDSL hydrolase family protein n=1 Tax=Legionella cardiaca TaxID=1071983 RepID=A0ABY8ATA0_9GAMM|nr:SGNH/GDSL hydrolase family protein [Legionella cardiaca]WED43709.1 SGNH/GDSL hydrolase family protein [Legionella cardiaca]
MPKPKIEYIVSLGDSLSDPGAMDHRKLLDVIPMDGLSGLKGKSPKGAFTNGYTWTTDFGNDLAEEEIIKHLKRSGASAIDIADGIIDHDPKEEKPLHDDFNLDGYKRLDLQGQDLLRYYDEGGATSYDYSERPIANLKLLATEKIVSNLAAKRRLLLADDKARGITAQHKQRTLVTEWSGANDLLTVNLKPNKEEAQKAVKARLENVEKLIAAGYCHFALFNLPDLSLTPQFQLGSAEDRDNAHEVCTYFNQLLAEGIMKLSEQYKEACSINLFDVNQIFTDAYNHPQAYGLDPAKKHTPYITSPDFKLNSDRTSPAPGYMFWDEKHPTAHVHKILAEKFYAEYSKKYHFTAPHESLLTQFKENYGQRWSDDMNGWFGFFRHSNLADYKSPDLTLTDILNHALNNKGKRTRDVITKLGWINAQGELISKNPQLVHAWQELNAHKESINDDVSCLFD